MNQSRHIPRLCFILTAALTLLGVALRSICLLFFYDSVPGYFAPGILPTLSNILYFVAAIAAAVCVALAPKDSLPVDLHTPMRAPSAILLGLSLTVFTIISLLICFPARKNDIMIAPTLLGLLSSAYYFVSAGRNGRYPDWLSLLGYLPVFWCITAVGDTYFDRYTTMNSPVKIALQIGFMGFMLIVLSELRFRVGQVKPRYSMAFLSIGSYACLVGSVPHLLATGAGLLNNLRHTLYSAVLLCAGLYGLNLLLRYTASAPNPPAASDATEDATEDATAEDISEEAPAEEATPETANNAE